MKFIDMVWAAFLARQNPVSTRAKPACMNMTRKPVMSVHTMLMATLLWPTVSITSSRAGLAGSFTVTSAAVPVTAPVGSGPLGAVAAAAGAAAGDSAGAGAASAGGAEGAGAGSCAWVGLERDPQTGGPSSGPATQLRT